MEVFLTYGRIVAVSLLRYFIVAGIPFIIFYKLFFEKYLRSKIQERDAKYKDFLREIKNSFFTTLIIGIVAFVFTKTPLRTYSQIYLEKTDYPLWWIPVSVVLALFIHDTYFYWMHRTVHGPKLYKHVHRVHHQSINPSPWASYSFHFFEAIAEALILPIIIFIIPMHPLAIILFAFSSFIINVYGHLGFEIAPLWFRRTWLFEIFNTSVHHNLHHSKFKGNYGLYFRVWDRLMGTENPDYVNAYDQVQEKRLAKTYTTKVSTT